MAGSDLFTGSLDLIVLKAVSWGPMHGYAIAHWLRMSTKEVLAVRDDFPQVPHLNLRSYELPRSLCLFDEPFRELKPRWTSAMLVERVRDWLRLTGRGELHADDQALEPLILAGDGTIVVPWELLNPDQEDRGVAIPLEISPPRSLQRRACSITSSQSMAPCARRHSQAARPSS